LLHLSDDLLKFYFSFFKKQLHCHGIRLHRLDMGVIVLQFIDYSERIKHDKTFSIHFFNGYIKDVAGNRIVHVTLLK
jgi:hypothetical protein